MGSTNGTLVKVVMSRRKYPKKLSQCLMHITEQ